MRGCSFHCSRRERRRWSREMAGSRKTGRHCYRGYCIGGIRSHFAIHGINAAQIKRKSCQIVIMCEAHGCSRVSARNSSAVHGTFWLRLSPSSTASLIHGYLCIGVDNSINYQMRRCGGKILKSFQVDVVTWMPWVPLLALLRAISNGKKLGRFFTHFIQSISLLELQRTQLSATAQTNIW